ncbi:hypothetical protein NQ314_004828 [Rhamnusium bicolor]|uniref:C3H1-type domain-containing protein n=1 Tax=Rhamnusium bicolor TaxID=1586634 RepID=A0AAV8ZLL8_9CUCU|nr:hypothetical protein NQ314_004828 [Rhamnusium bicolor]
MSLVPDYGDSSNSSFSNGGDSEPENVGASQTIEIPPVPSPKYKLPTPNFEGIKNDAEESKSSVFKNPFIEAEHAKEAILQKHVKMVDTKDNIVVINGKKICWNYRKGRCRFGHNCKFAHDSDIQKTNDQVEAEKIAAIQNSVVCQSNQMGHSQYMTVTQDVEQTQEESIQNKQKRKRPGLTQGLIPGKKVMKNYIKNQKI